MDLVRARGMTLSLSLALLIAMVPASASSSEEQGSIHLDSLEIGDIVAVGEPRDDACYFEDPVHVKVEPERNTSGTVQSAFEVTDECEAELVTREENEGNDSVHTASSTTVNNRVYHYGTGGQEEVLTEVTDEIAFSHDGSQASIVYSAGVICFADSHWEIDDCQTDDKNSPGNPAYQISQGDFYRDRWWSPPDYHHTLESLTGGYASGQPYCEYSWEGSITAGVSNECTVT